MRLLAVVLSLVSAFFVFHFVRLLAVTEFLQRTRRRGQGAYLGAVAFPLIAFGAAWAARRAWKR